MKKTSINTTLIALIILENLALLYFFKAGILGQKANSLAYFLSGLMFGILVLRKFYGSAIENYPVPGRKAKLRWLPIAACGIAIVWLAVLTTRIYRVFIIDYHYSDIIPAIQIMVQRFLNGAYPYSPLTSLGYTTPAGYMPMHWLPFCLAEIGHFDYRFVTFGLWCLAAIILFARSFRRHSTSYSGFTVLLLSGSYYLILRQSDGIIGITVELLIAAYYMLMITGLNQKNAWLQGLLIAFCLLSRYTLILWLPLWCFVLIVSGHQKQLAKALMILFLAILLLYIIPFLRRDLSLFFTTVKGYSNLSWEWQHVDDNGKPFHLYNGVGFAYLFFEHYRNIDPLTGFQALRKVFFALTTGSVLLMGVWYWLKRNKIDYRIFLMASFKIYLTIFLAFVLVPYQYLMITGNFVSIAIFVEQLRYRTNKNAGPAKT